MKEDQRATGSHEMLSELAELAITYDQLDATNVAVVEQIFRFQQDIEQDVKRKAEATKDFSISQCYLGRSRKTGGALICPDLVAFSADQAMKESAILTEARKAQEERKLQKGK